MLNTCIEMFLSNSRNEKKLWGFREKSPERESVGAIEREKRAKEEEEEEEQ